MQILSCFTSFILVFALSFINGLYGSTNIVHDSSNGKLDRDIDTYNTNTTPMIYQPSKNDTLFSAEAHLTFSSQCEFTKMTPHEEGFLDSTMIRAFEQSKIKVSNLDDVGRTVRMIDAQIVSKKKIDNKDKKIGKDMRRNIRYRPQRYRYYRIYDFSILFDFGCGNLCGDKSGFWDRHRYLKEVDSPSSDKFGAIFGRNVCSMLRASTYEVFKTVTDCRMRIV
jgi:hypothetical protein